MDEEDNIVGDKQWGDCGWCTHIHFAIGFLFTKLNYYTHICLSCFCLCHLQTPAHPCKIIFEWLFFVRGYLLNSSASTKSRCPGWVRIKPVVLAGCWDYMNLLTTHPGGLQRKLMSVVVVIFSGLITDMQQQRSSPNKGRTSVLSMSGGMDTLWKRWPRVM